ncbi:MAG TPA: hypothetical protein VH597_09325 [Verrucomicrobiae bacterium]|jgi:autotransporter-associated beta strand protein|nr:hypothetical protein [Verrucomicrobiae bacterium]
MKKNLRLFKSFLPALVVAMIGSALPAGAQSLWNATNSVSVDTNWSTAANWVPNVVPTASSNVVFNDTGAAIDTVTIDNVVDTSTTIRQLAFRQTNGVHNTLILPGVTLTISNAVAATNLFAGTDTTASPATLMVTNTISGAGGTLAITSTNISSVLAVRQISTTAGSHNEILDLSGLDTFSASVGNVWVGVFPGTGTTRPQGILFLAKTNSITTLAVGSKLAPSIDVGDTGSSPGLNNLLALGIVNNIAADNIVVGNQRCVATLNFNPAFTNGTLPSLFLRGHSGTRVTTFNIGDNSSATAAIGSFATGVVDFSGGTVDAMIGSMTLGDGQAFAGAGVASGTLIMAAGALNINTLEIGFQTTNSSTAANTGTVNINGGTLTVNSTLRLARYNVSGGTTVGTLNITNGTVLASNIVAGTGISTINMSGGTLVVSNALGTSLVPLSSLNVSAGATLQFPVANGATAAAVTTLTGDGTAVINISSLPALGSYPTQFPVITYQNGSGAGLVFLNGTLPGTFQGTISNDNSSTIWVVITSGPNLASASWRGNVNNQWDTTTLNWNTGGSASKYQDGDVVTFDDLAQTNIVNVTGAFAPTNWVQNNSVLNYIFNGAGNITGVAALTMNGTATVTLADTGGDNFSGGVVVNSGTVILDDANSTISGGLKIVSGAMAQIGNNDANGVLPAGIVDDEGSLVFNRSDNLVISNAIGGAGTLTQGGSGILSLSVPSTYSGMTTVTNGTLALTNSGSIASSVQVNVTGGTLDVSGVAGTATLSSLTLANGGLTVVSRYLQTNLVVNGFSMGGTSNVINVSSLPPIASYPATIVLVQSPNGISGFNMTVGAFPAGSVSGGVALSPDTTAIILTVNSGPIGVRPQVLWTGADMFTSTNWSDGTNWQSPGAPGAGENVVFNDFGTAPNGTDMSAPGGGISALLPDNVNNFANGNFTIGSLTYSNNFSTFHNTAIANGAILAVTNFVKVGVVDGISLAQAQFVNIAGGGGATFNVNNISNGTFQVWIGDSGTATTFATLDMSALDNFTANISKMGIGACTTDNQVNRPSGNIYLARTNVISCSYTTTNSVEAGSATGNSGIIIGDCNQNQGQTSLFYLGQANTISADSIGIARQKSSGTMQFNPIYTNGAPYPSVTFKGYTTTLVSNLDVGDGIGNSGTTAGIGDLNLTGGFVTASVDTLNVGRASGATSGAGTTTGTLEFEAGTITANTVNIGLQPTIGAKVGVGTISVFTNSAIGAAGTLIVNGNLNLGVSVNNTNATPTSGTLNINGGTVQAANIVAGSNSALSAINLNAGTLIVTGSAGSTGAPLTGLVIADGATLQLNVNGGAGAASVVAGSITTSGSSQTITLRIGALTGVVAGNTYPLISYQSGDPFASLSLAPLPAGYAGTLVDNGGVVAFHVTTAPPPALPAQITHVGVSGTTLTLSATNGVDGGRVVLLGTTNLVQPLSQWTPLLTNSFDANGNLNLSTNIINPAVPQQFFILSQ